MQLVLDIDIDKDGERFYVYEVSCSGTEEQLRTLEGEEGGRGPWIEAREDLANIMVEGFKKQYGVESSVRVLTVWV